LENFAHGACSDFKGCTLSCHKQSHGEKVIAVARQIDCVPLALVHLRSVFITYWQPLFLFVVTLVAAGVFCRMGVDPHHDGIMLKPAFDVADGKMLFRDSYCQYGALTSILQGWAVLIFGHYLLVIKILTAFFYACGAALLWFNWVKIMPAWLAWLSGLLWLSMAPFLITPELPWSSVYAIPFQLISTLWIMRFIDKNHQRFVFASGIAAGLVFWCRQPVGVVHLAALIIILATFGTLHLIEWKKSLQALVVLLAGEASTFLVFMSWLVINGALRDWWKQSIKFSVIFGMEYFGRPTPGHLFRVLFPYPNITFRPRPNYQLYDPCYMWDLLPLASFALLGLILWRLVIRHSKEKRDAMLFVYLIVALGSWHQYYPLSDAVHAFWAAGMMVGILSVLFWELAPIRRRFPRPVIVIMALALCFWPYLRVPLIACHYNAHSVPFETPVVLKGMLSSPEEVANLSSFSKSVDVYLENHPNAGMIDATEDALYITFRDDRALCFHPAYVKWAVLQHRLYLDYQKALLDCIERERPLAVVTLTPDLKGFDSGVKDGVPVVWNGEETFSGYGVWQRFERGITLIAPASCKYSPLATDGCELQF
jgi:hypothetical protein